MAQQGVLGNGTKFAYSVASPVSWVRVAQLMNIDKFPELVADIIDNTVMGTSNQMTGFVGMIPIPTFEVTLLADLDPTTTPSHEALRQYSAGSGLSTAGAALWLRIEVPVNRTQTSFRAFEFQGVVNGWTLSPPISDKQTLKITVVLSTAMSVYPPASSAIS